MDMELKETQAGIASSVDNIKHPLSPSMDAKPKKPNEIPQPGKNPETIPSEEPEPNTWPRKEPEIQPGKEPLTIPPTAPPEVPKPPENQAHQRGRSLRLVEIVAWINIFHASY